MRISEKTVELNLCAQINQNLNQRILWFGLTQKQEALLGFDAAFRLNAKVLLFQFKASNKTLRSGARRFTLEHNQLQKLRNLVPHTNRSVYYVFPLIGNTSELNQHDGDFYNNTMVLDVSTLPNPFPLPLTHTVPPRLRKNPIHYADVLHHQVTIHSEPVEAELQTLNSIVKEGFYKSSGINDITDDFKDYPEKLWDILKPIGRNFKMAVVYTSVVDKYNL